MMKKTLIFFLAICIICFLNVVCVFGTMDDFNDIFDSEPVISTTEGWMLKTADGTAGIILTDTYIYDETQRALSFVPSGESGSTLAAERVFPARTGRFVINFEIAFKEKGTVNLLYAYQGSTLLFAITADDNKIGVWTGTGNYDNASVYRTLLSSYTINKAYNFNVAVNSDKQIFNVYINDKLILNNEPLRNKITTGMNKVAMMSASNSTVNWQLSKLGINSPKGNPSVTNVSIDKTPYLYEKITLSYTYEGDEQDDYSTVRWMYSNEENGQYEYVYGAEGENLIISPYLAGKWIKAEVTPCDGMFATGIPVYSKPVFDVSDKIISVDESTEYTTKNNAEWDSSNGILTLTTKKLLAPEAVVLPTKNITGTVVFEASIKNKNKDAACVFYVYKDREYVFNIVFNAAHIVLSTGSEPGAGYTTQNLVSNYAANTWYDIKVVMNTTANTADFYVDDTMIYEGLYLRSDLTTKGITEIVSFRGSSPEGETYIKDLKLYSVSTPELKAISAKIDDVVIYTGFGGGSGCARLNADLLNQFGEKVKNSGFEWELVSNVEGVNLTPDGILMINKATTESIKIKAVSKDDKTIVANVDLGTFGSFSDTFESELVISSSDGWTLKIPDGAGTIGVESYVIDETKKALTFTSSGKKDLILAAERAFPARNGMFVIDFETTFKQKGATSLLYAYQGSTLLFAITADDNKMGAWTGKGEYDNTAEYRTLLNSYDINTPYHFQIVVNSCKQIFNVYINGEKVLENAHLRNKITTGMTKASLFQASDSKACWQILNLDIKEAKGAHSITDVSIEGTPYLGKTIAVNYTYDGEPISDFSIVRWMYSDMQNGEYKYISEATEKFLTIPIHLVGKWIKAEITPCNGKMENDIPVYSEPVLDRTHEIVVVDKNTEYITNSNAVWNHDDNILTLTSKDSLAPETVVIPKQNITGMVIFEASIRNKNKDSANAFYVYQDSDYVFNITFDANNIYLFCSSVAGENKYLSKVLVSKYIADTWYDIKVVINSGKNTADFYVNGELIFEGIGLRVNLTKGITKIYSFRPKTPYGETYIKGLKLYGVSIPELKATSIKILEPVIYNTDDVFKANLKADLLDQFGGKIENSGFKWELVTQTEGVTLSNDGVLSVSSKTIEYVMVRAISLDDESITCEKQILIQKCYEINNFNIYTNYSQSNKDITLDRNITAIASADVLCYFGSNDVVLVLAYYDSFGKMMYVNTESKKIEYNVLTPISSELMIESDNKTTGGYFKAYIFDSLENLKPLTASIIADL